MMDDDSIKHELKQVNSEGLELAQNIFFKKE